LLITGAVAAGLLTVFGYRHDGPLVVQHNHRRILPKPPDRQIATASREASPSGVHAFARPRVVLHGRGDPGQDVLPVGLGHLAGHWSEWDRARALRKVSRGQSRASRVTEYLHYAPGRGGRPLPQARVVCGEGKELKLVGVYVQVVVEGPRVRTLIDHVFSNPANEVLSGTFEYTLPEGDSPSYFAVFPGGDGRRREEKPHAEAPPVSLPSPERLVQSVSRECWGEPRRAAVAAVPAGREPAEDAQPTKAPGEPRPNFRGSVGLVRKKSLIRVVVASEGALRVRAGKAVYRFALPKCEVHDLSFSLQVDEALAKGAALEPAAEVVLRGAGRVLYSRKWKDATAAGEVRFEAPLPDPAFEAASGRHGDSGPRYVFARVRPEFPPAAKETAFARHAVFLLDTSAGEDPRRYALSVRLLKAVLENDSDLEHFNVLTFSTGPAWLSLTGWLENTKEVRQRILPRLEAAALEGATDLSAALEAAAKPTWEVPDDLPVSLFLLSDGSPTWGEADAAGLAARFEARCKRPVRWHCYRTGLGSENEELFAALTRRGGGTYRLAGADDLEAASLAHRSRCLLLDHVGFEGGPKASEVLVAGRRVAVHPGGELVIAGRFAEDGKTTLVVEGTLGGKKVKHRYPVEVGDDGQLAPRAWGELAVASLLSVRDPSLEPLAATIGRQFRVASRVTSFAYVQDDPDEDADEIDAQADLEEGWRRRGQDEAAGQRVRAMLREAAPPSARRDVELLWKLMREDDLPWPAARVAGSLTSRKAPSAAYLSSGEPAAFLDEAVRRAAAKDPQGAIRALSGLLERSPQKADAVRLVAYHLIATGEAEAAARLLLEQTRQQPHDPAHHRALGLALALAGRHAWAALHYETALALLADEGGWFRAVRAEYGDLLAIAAKDGRLRQELRDHFRIRLRELEGTPGEPDLRVSVTWNASSSAVELEVADPAGKALPEVGAKLKGDRQGPRVCLATKAQPGTYRAAARLAKATAPETCVIVVVRRGQERERRVFLLRQAGERTKAAEVRVGR
jgi:hypothetical protein